jgi:DNA end-binding protein Ku
MNLIIDYRWLGIMFTATTEEPVAKAKKPKRRAAGQREMLLPIFGNGTAKEAAKEKATEPARPATRQRKAG